ncbi:MAG: DUF4145 domain-containing protein [Sandaracinaceae bacterium]|nr:DUF4145 domain-containing protein [Sandaracinaceae bacterium]
MKQRSFVEHVVAAIYESYRLRPPYSDNLNDLMNETAFRQAVPEVVQNKLHAVRKAGNHAAHPRRPITSQLSLECLTQLFDIARWFLVQVDRRRTRRGPERTCLRPPCRTAARRRRTLSRSCGSPRRSTRQCSSSSTKRPEGGSRRSAPQQRPRDRARERRKDQGSRRSPGRSSVQRGTPPVAASSTKPCSPPDGTSASMARIPSR